jgi:hypothetical protein
MVYVKLAKNEGYKLTGVHTKLGQQRVGPFPIIGAIGFNAYKLDLPHSWLKMGVHPVLSVAQLEPAPEEADPFERPPLYDEPPPVQDGHENDSPEHLIEAIIKKRVRKLRKGVTVIEYRVKWKGYNAHHNQWLRKEELHPDLVSEYKATLPGN